MLPLLPALVVASGAARRSKLQPRPKEVAARRRTKVVVAVGRRRVAVAPKKNRPEVAAVGKRKVAVERRRRVATAAVPNRRKEVAAVRPIRLLRLLHLPPRRALARRRCMAKQHCRDNSVV